MRPVKNDLTTIPLSSPREWDAAEHGECVTLPVQPTEEGVLNVLSLFDGISCGRVALERAGIPVANYYASEIDKYAMQVSARNYPDIVQLGDVQQVRIADLPFVPDLIIGGSPCQGFSFAGKQLAFDDPRSKLFFEFVRLVDEARMVNPNVKFFLENVKMKAVHIRVISRYLGVKPVRINSALVSAQNRDRYYWANFPITLPADRGIVLRDIVEDGLDYVGAAVRGRYLEGNSGATRQRIEASGNTKANALTCVQKDSILLPKKGLIRLGNSHPSGRGMNGVIYDIAGKAPAITTNKGEGSKIGINGAARRGRDTASALEIRKDQKANALLTNGHQSRLVASNGDQILYRKLTPIECERLQTLPDGYTGGGSRILSDTRR